MNIVFFGTSIFAVPSLKALAKTDHRVLLVVTQPDRKKGRHLRLSPPPIKEIASSLGVDVFQPADASAQESVKRLRQSAADLFVVVSFGQILSKDVLSAPKRFAINLHASLLPKYRGAAPISRAIINGESKTGVTVFRLEEEMDSGDIIGMREAAIEDNDTALTLGERLSNIGAEALIEAVEAIDKDKVVFKRQDPALVTFAPKLKKEDGLIDWGLSAAELRNRVRGLLPWPGAYTNFKGRMLKIIEAKALPAADKAASPGRIVGIEPEAGILVNTRAGLLAIQRLQIEGSRPMAFEEFARGHKIQVGDLLG